MRKRSLSKSKRIKRRRTKRKGRSKCKYVRKSIKRDGAIITVYKDNETKYIEVEDGSECFRKYFKTVKQDNGEERMSIEGNNEYDIVSKLKVLYDKDKLGYNKNLIVIRNIGKDEKGLLYYETDTINPYVKGDEKIEGPIYKQLLDLNKTRKYLAENGILYIDWKIDNIGLDKSDKVILFDFDGSGLFTPENSDKNIKTKWELEPTNTKNFNYALSIFGIYGCSNTNPRSLDAFLFRNMIFNEINEPNPNL